MALTNQEAKRQRRELMRDIAREHKKKDRATLGHLREAIRLVKTRRREAMIKVVQGCRVGRARARELAKARVAQVRAEARALVVQLRREEAAKARSRCTARKTRVATAALSSRAKRKHLLLAEKRLQAEIVRIEGWAKKRQRRHEKTALERRHESDDEVRQNIPEDLHALFERVKRSIKGSAHQSRTEALLHYAEEHPGEVVDAQEELSQREIARMIREEASLRHAMRSPRRYRPSSAELAAVPF